MKYEDAKKLHNGEEVGIKKVARCLDDADNGVVLGDVRETTVLFGKKAVMVPVLLPSGELREFMHKDLK